MNFAILARPFSQASYLLGQKVNLIYGCIVIGFLAIAATGWCVARWRTRHERGKHAALYRVRTHAARKP